MLNTAAGPVPPTVPTSFVTDSGTAVPAANILNVVTPGGGTQGIVTSGSGSTITITLTDTTLTGTATTVGATTANINVNIPIPTNSTTSCIINVAGFSSDNLGLGGESIGAVRNVAGVLTVISINDTTKNNDNALAGWTIGLTTSGTNALVQVTGVAGKTINWRAIIEIVTAP